MVAITFAVGWFLGTFGPYWLAPITAILLAVPAIYFLGKICDRAFSDMLGGLLFDLMFSDGMGASEARPKPRHSLALLRHWRDQGWVKKASREVRKNLTDHGESFDSWMFAIETATVHQNSAERGRQLTLALLRCKNFSEDQRCYAQQQLKAWAAQRGVHIELRQTARQTQKPLNRAVQLRDLGYFQEAEVALRLILEKDPENLAAVQLLIRLYAQDLKQPEKALRWLAKLEKDPYTPAWFIDYLKNSWEEWCRQRPRSVARKRSLFSRLANPMPAKPETKIKLGGAPPVAAAPAEPKDTSTDVNELLAEGRLESALVQAEQNAKTDPNNFAALKQVLEIHCMGVTSLKKAEKVLRKIEANTHFSEEQKEEARKKFRDVKQQQANILYRMYS